MSCYKKIRTTKSIGWWSNLSSLGPIELETWSWNSSVMKMISKSKTKGIMYCLHNLRIWKCVTTFNKNSCRNIETITHSDRLTKTRSKKFCSTSGSKMTLLSLDAKWTKSSINCRRLTTAKMIIWDNKLKCWDYNSKVSRIMTSNKPKGSMSNNMSIELINSKG